MKQVQLLSNTLDAVNNARAELAAATDLLDDAIKDLSEQPQRVEAGEDINEEGWHNDVAYAYRLLLQNGAQSAVIYFASEPHYSTVKAFARAAGLPVNAVQVEQRDG